MLNSEYQGESLNIDVQNLVSDHAIPYEPLPNQRYSTKNNLNSIEELEMKRQRLLLQKNHLNREIEELQYLKESLGTKNASQRVSSTLSNRTIGSRLSRLSKRKSRVSKHHLLLDEIKR